MTLNELPQAELCAALRRPADLTHLPHGTYTRLVRHHIDPFWGMAAEDPAAWAKYQRELEEDGITEQEAEAAARKLHKGAWGAWGAASFLEMVIGEVACQRSGFDGDDDDDDDEDEE